VDSAHRRAALSAKRGVSSSAAPGTGNGEGAPARPDAQRLDKDLHSASSLAGSFSVVASAITDISHTDMET
jgi:hypothetical protein